MSMDYKVFSGLCPDERCETKLYFPAHKTVIECPSCGQCHSKEKLNNIAEVTDGEEALTQVLRSIVWDAKMPKKGSDAVKVHGLSNYHCKLLSPLFTKYGMDKEGNPRLLSELGHGETADCGRLLSHRAFLIAPEHIEITGYGRDQSGSVQYLEGLLDMLNQYHGGEERLIPIHADGDGHCLVHALSRATTGRELFWHALRDNLVNHLEKNLETYKNLFRDFIDQDDWRIIIEEADPYCVSPEGFNVGLGNIHIFALANVLRRPIVLLDSLEGMKNVADYTAIFVPALVEPSQCRDHLPLCVAWSGSSHNHFVPLVGVAGRPLPAIPQPLIPNIWGIDRNQGMRYLNFNNDGSLTVAGGKPLQRGYLLRLVSAMEKVFLEHHSVEAKLVADMHLYVYQRVGFVGLHPDIVTDNTRDAVVDGRIYRCLICHALTLSNIDEDSLQPGGYLYKVMLDSHGTPRTDVTYNFPIEEIQCKYDAIKGCLVPVHFKCSWCSLKRLRKVDRFGNTKYENGDPTSSAAEIPGQCCGCKHYWDGKEYENLPKEFMLNITMQGKKIEEKVTWFYGDCNPELNSSGKKIASKIAEKYFVPDDPDTVEHKIEIYSAIQSAIERLGLNDEEAINFNNPYQSEAVGLPQLKEDQTVQSRPLPKGRSSDLPSTSKVVALGKKGPLEMKEHKFMLETAPVLESKQPKKVSSTLAMPDGTVKIRVSTSDGRQETLLVDDVLDYIGLQNTVQKHFGILPSRQVHKLGFPPKALGATSGKKPLGLRNGDRIMVEIKSERFIEKKMPDNKKFIQDRSLLKKGVNRSGAADDCNEALHSFADLLQTNKTKGFERSSSLSAASVDGSLVAISNMVEVSGKSVWDYAISHPELFHPGGAFYKQFNRDIGLTHGRHCMLPLLPGRVFRYNADADQIELCLEPTGHFPIAPEIAEVLEKISTVCKEAPSEKEVEVTLDQKDDNGNLVPVGTIKDVGVEVQLKDEAPKDESQHMGTEKLCVDYTNTNPTPSTDQTPSNVVSLEQGASSVDGHHGETVMTESKRAPGFSTLGHEPTQISQEEAELKRLELLNVLKSKKRQDS